MFLALKSSSSQRSSFHINECNNGLLMTRSRCSFLKNESSYKALDKLTMCTSRKCRILFLQNMFLRGWWSYRCMFPRRV